MEERKRAYTDGDPCLQAVIERLAIAIEKLIKHIGDAPSEFPDDDIPPASVPDGSGYSGR